MQGDGAVDGDGSDSGMGVEDGVVGSGSGEGFEVMVRGMGLYGWMEGYQSGHISELDASESSGILVVTALM